MQIAWNQNQNLKQTNKQYRTSTRSRLADRMEPQLEIDTQHRTRTRSRHANSLELQLEIDKQTTQNDQNLMQTSKHLGTRYKTRTTH